MSDLHTGEDMATLFAGMFDQPSRIKDRRTEERQSLKTPAQKAAQKPVEDLKSAQNNFRSTAAEKAFSLAVARDLNMSVADVFLTALKEFAARRNVPR